MNDERFHLDLIKGSLILQKPTNPHEYYHYMQINHPNLNHAK